MVVRINFKVLIEAQLSLPLTFKSPFQTIMGRKSCCPYKHYQISLFRKQVKNPELIIHVFLRCCNVFSIDFIT